MEGRVTWVLVTGWQSRTNLPGPGRGYKELGADIITAKTDRQDFDAPKWFSGTTTGHALANFVAFIRRSSADQ